LRHHIARFEINAGEKLRLTKAFYDEASEVARLA
jgi:hypothetical protein